MTNKFGDKLTAKDRLSKINWQKSVDRKLGIVFVFLAILLLIAIFN